MERVSGIETRGKRHVAEAAMNVFLGRRYYNTTLLELLSRSGCFLTSLVYKPLCPTELMLSE